MPKTKIIATLGPASSSETILRKMMLQGLDVVRLNFSHGTHNEHLERLKIVRTINKKYRRKIKILVDLEGHRIRISLFNSEIVELKKNQKVILSNIILPHKDIIYFDYAGSIFDIKKGNHIFIDDGNLHLIVNNVTKYKIFATVIEGGILKSRKGINIPDAKLKFKGLSQKDRLDILWGLRNQVDYIAQSFVTNKQDIIEIRKFISANNPNNYFPKIISKIENREGIKNLSEILDVSDGIMVARGDLGISVPIWEVPFIQKYIIKKCNERKKFVITATHMLESMTENPIPTRAEVSDVANAILDGTDFVMLSGETAVGKYPVNAVRLMNQIIKFTEDYKESL